MSEVIKVIQLVSGENLIAKVEYPTAETMFVKKAVLLMPTNANGNVATIPWPLFGDQYNNGTSIVLDRKAVVVEYVPSAPLEAEYRRVISGLITPPTESNKLILG